MLFSKSPPAAKLLPGIIIAFLLFPGLAQRVSATAFDPAAFASPPDPPPQQALRDANRRLALCRRQRDLVCQTETEIALGRVFERLGDADGARLHFGKALDLSERGENPDLSARALFRFSLLPPAPGLRPRDLIERALPLAHQGRNEETLVWVQIRRGELLLAEGRFAEALAPLGEALRLAERRKMPHEKIAAIGAGALAKESLGRPQEALDDLARGISLALPPGFERERAELAAERARIELDLGRWSAASGSADLSIETSDAAGLGERGAKSRLLRGAAFLELGKEQEAERAFEEARSYYSWARNSQGVSEVAIELLILRLGGAGDNARLADLESLAPAPGEARHPRTAALLLVLHARSAESANDFVRAERDYRRALGLANSAGDAELSSRIHGRIAVINRQLGRFGESVAELRGTIDKLRRQARTADLWWYLGELGESYARSGFWRQAAASFDGSIVELERRGGRTRNRILAHLLPIDPNEAFRRVIEFRLTRGDKAGAFSAAEAAHARSIAELAQTTGGRGGWEPLPTADLFSKLEATLPRGTVFAEFLVFEPTSYLFVVDRGGLEVSRLPGASILSKQVESSRRALQNPAASLLSALPSLRPLASTVLTPILKKSSTAISRLIVVPDGALSSFPVDALPLASVRNEPVHFLFEDTNVTFVPSAAAWLDIGGAGPHRAAGGEDLAVILREGGSRETSLARSAEEARQAFRRFRGARVVLDGVEATPKSFLQKIPSTVPILHFALPARIDSNDPEQSALILDDGNGGPSPLSIAELGRKPLETDLTSIAAVGEDPAESPGWSQSAICSTFLATGSHAVLLPAWNLTDQQTATFFAGFHEAIRKGLSPEQALFLTKRRQAAAGGSGGAPFWTAFRIVGDGGRPVRAPRAFPGKLLIAFLAVTVGLLVGALGFRRARARRKKDRSGIFS